MCPQDWEPQQGPLQVLWASWGPGGSGRAQGRRGASLKAGQDRSGDKDLRCQVTQMDEMTITRTHTQIKTHSYVALLVGTFFGSGYFFGSDLNLISTSVEFCK